MLHSMPEPSLSSKFHSKIQISFNRYMPGESRNGCPKICKACPIALGWFKNAQKFFLAHLTILLKTLRNMNVSEPLKVFLKI